MSHQGVAIVVRRVATRMFSFTYSNAFYPLVFLEDVVRRRVRTCVRAVFVAFFYRSNGVFRYARVQSCFPGVYRYVSAI